MNALSSRPATSVRSSHKPLVYLAEDDADLRRLVADALCGAGFQVLAASDGHEMLRLLSAASRGEIAAPDALVLDVRMPRCSGLDVLAALRLADWDQPIVVMTGFGDAVLHDQASSRGASVVLDKPFESDDLVRMLDILLLFSGQPEEDGCQEPPTLRCRLRPTSTKSAD